MGLRSKQADPAAAAAAGAAAAYQFVLDSDYGLGYNPSRLKLGFDLLQLNAHPFQLDLVSTR